ncbi:hypothetical protein [Halopelagius fulvigenes]|uniref:Domain of unknown function domain-containing protein n=1 Tax=Halopelagius fulvigenes TaxID=1198324 RepID=A0ABD5U3A8_9EURY
MGQSSDDFAARPKGILNEKERKHLMGTLDGEESEAAMRQREYRIRQRLRHTLIDFQLLADSYDSILEPVFSDLVGTEEGDDPLLYGIEALFTLLYRALSEYSPEEGLQDHVFYPLLDNGVSEAVQLEYVSQGFSVDPARTLFKVHGTDPAVSLDTVEAQYKDGESMSTKEMKHLYWSGRIPYEEYRDYDALNFAALVEEHGEDEAMDMVESQVQSWLKRRRESAAEDVPVVPEYGGFIQKKHLNNRE